MYTRILVPLDGSALAERAVSHASKIARAMGAELILAQFVQPPLGGAPEAGQSEEVRAIRDAGAEANAYLAGIAGRLSGEGCNSVRVEIREGAPAEGILGLAHNDDVDLIVMCTHGRTGLSKMLMGSVAEKVMLTTKRPVMLVKPERVRATRVDEADVFLSAH